ncbi:MAG: hypothetical protein ACI4XG_04530, partial [Bradyrhizobium sp.]
KAKAAFSSVMGKMKGAAQGSFDVSTAWPDSAAGGLKAGLVVTHEENSAVVKIAFRAARNASELLAMPMYYTEVRFQGVVD